MTTTLSEFLTSINRTKEDVMSADPRSERDYVPFVVNRTFSYFPDTIFQANEMNMRADLPAKMQYDFLMATIRPRSRFKRWDRKKGIDNLEIVKQYYGYSSNKAEQIIDLLSEEQIGQIKEQLYQGGMRNDKR